jgi:hypothetical protein
MNDIKVAIKPGGIGTEIFLNGKKIDAATRKIIVEINPSSASMTVEGLLIGEDGLPLIAGEELQTYSCNASIEEPGEINLSSPMLARLLQSIDRSADAN